MITRTGHFIPGTRLTIQERYAPAMRVTDREDAAAYFESLVQHTMSLLPEKSRTEVEELERRNLGYFCGYYDRETMERVFELFDCEHPIFGRSQPTPEEAFQAGVEWVAGRAEGA